jgi:hypothetical protein
MRKTITASGFKLVRFSLSLGLLLGFFSSVSGSTCIAPGPVCYEYWKTDVVFVGRVTAISYPDFPEGQTSAPATLVHFSVEEVFRGVKGNEIEIASGTRRLGNLQTSADGMGYRLEIGQRYLVYGHRSTTDRWIRASVCSRTRPLAEAADDLKYIRGLSRAQPGANIFGTVFRRWEWIKDDREGPLKGIRVYARGQGKEFEAVTNSKGEYSFSGLRLGSYKVGFIVPSNFAADGNHRTVELEQDRGCVQADFRVWADGVVSGTVTDTDGRPVPTVNVDIIAAGVSAEEQADKRWTSLTDEKGHFEIRAVPPGGYLLGINIADVWGVGYDASYYPGVSEVERAQIVVIAEGQKVSGLDLRVPRVTTRRTLQGVVYLADRKPAIGVLVALESSADKGPRWDLAVKTDQQGQFSITEHDSYVLWIHARYAGLEGEAKHAEPIRLEKNIGPVGPFSLDLTMPGASCPHYRQGDQKDPP